MQGLGNTADLGGEGVNGRPQGGGTRHAAPAPCVQRARGLRGIRRYLLHGSILSEVGASTKPGVVHSAIGIVGVAVAFAERTIGALPIPCSQPDNST
jgi:hypothetical protein